MGRPDLEPEILGKARAGDIRNCFADIGKARDLLGFEPQHRLEDSLGDFVGGSAAHDGGGPRRRACGGARG
jgi:dTDP-L-rhamnose 4-epimerase